MAHYRNDEDAWDDSCRWERLAQSYNDYASGQNTDTEFASQLHDALTAEQEARQNGDYPPFGHG